MEFIALDLDLVIGTQEVHIYAAEKWPRAVRILGFCAAAPVGPAEVRRFMDAITCERGDGPRMIFACEGAEVLGLARLEWVLSVDDRDWAGPLQIEANGLAINLVWG